MIAPTYPNGRLPPPLLLLPLLLQPLLPPASEQRSLKGRTRIGGRPHPPFPPPCSCRERRRGLGGDPLREEAV
jgi:hypothetical protein